ncbi:MAG: Fpg/Nei family DNA glycosylase [Acidimicrobiia bacterium]|nr:Fpg/Nei family DNA glycosylase [Acidimicrobiia bacterium]
MPEGHTIHRLARDQRRSLAGRPVRASSPQGRFAEGAARLDGAVLRRVEAWGKHLFQTYATGDVLHVHLGLIGVFRPQPSPPAPPVGLLRLRLEGGALTWDLSGPNVCAVIDPDAKAAVIARLGPDPLRPDSDPERFVQRVRRSKAPIGTLLLDQSVIAGIGNVYRAEMLWVFGIHPAREGPSISEDELRAMWRWIVDQLKVGVRRNRIVTIDPAQLGKPISRVRRGEGVAIYHQELCLRCGASIARLDVANRRIDVCLSCQT